MPSYLLAAASVYETLHQFVVAYKVHPILVNFTAARFRSQSAATSSAGSFASSRSATPAGGPCVLPR